MVTAEEIGAIAVFAGLADGRPRAALARGGRHHASRPASTPRTRATSGRSSPCSRAGSRRSSSSTGSSASSASAAAATSSARCRSCSAPSSRSGFRAAETSRVMRIEPHDYHAVAAVAARRREGGRHGSRPTGWAGRAGCRASPPSRRRRARSSSATAGTPSCAELRRFLDRNQITLHVAPARRARTRPSSGAARCRPTTTARRSASSTARRSVRPQLRRVAELLGLAHRAGGRRVRHGDRRRRPGRPGRRRLRRVGGPAHDRGRARGARRPGRHVLADRELPRLPVGRLRRRAREPRAAAGAPARRRDPRHPRRSRGSTPATRQVHLDGGDVLRARTIILACGVAWRQLAIEGFDRLAGKGISYGAARSEAPNTHGLDVHIVGAGNSAGPGGDVLLHPRAQRDHPLPRRRRSRRACRATSIDQLATRPNIRRCYRTRGRRRARRRRRSRRSTSATRRPARRPGSSRAACSSSSAPTPRPAGCRPRSRSTAAATCSPAPTCAPPGAGSSTATRTCSRRACPGIFACGDVRFGPVKRVAAAVGEGSMAIAFVHQYLKDVESSAPMSSGQRAGLN